MSVVVILCDFYNVFQIDGSYLFRPKSHQKALKKLIQLIQQFLQSHLMSKYFCPGASLAVEKEKNVGEVFFKRVLIFFFRTETPMFKIFFLQKKLTGFLGGGEFFLRERERNIL